MQMKRPLAIAFAGLLLLAGCGDDDDSASDDDGTTTTEQAGDKSSAEASGEWDPFCQAELEVEAAIASEGDVEGAMGALSEAAPEEAKETVETTIAEAQNFMADGGEPTPEFNAAYAEMIGLVKDNCGFGEIDVTGSEYDFAGLDGEIAAGPNVVTFANEGEEVHEVVIMRINDDVTESVDELLALPEEEAMEKVTPAAGAFAMPGETGYTAAELDPGRYVAVCFVPVGTTPEAMETMDPNAAPEGEPHFAHGMVAEFEVA